MGIILRPSIHDERAEEEGATYHGIVRYTHVRCGYTTRIRGEMELLNDLDPACPKCSETCRTAGHASDENEPTWPCNEAYGAMVWEQADGTIFETYSNGSELVRHQQVCTHVHVYKSWVNGPEWWVRPEPNTGDMDDNLIIGFDTYRQAIEALPDQRSIFDSLAPPDGIAWRDRRNPIYQLTPPKEDPVHRHAPDYTVPITPAEGKALMAAVANPLVPLPEGCTPVTAAHELDASGPALTLGGLGREFDGTGHTEVWLDWALQVRQWGFTWAEALTIARVWYFG